MTLNLQQIYRVVSASGETKELSLADIFSANKKTLLYFYPRDNTPGCTLENTDFSSMVQDYKNQGITLVWVSKDTTESHQKFISQHNLQIDLISDSDLNLHKQLWAYGEKNNYWKIVQWVIRSTFLFDNQGNILQQWKNVRAKWHAQRILKEVQD